MPARCVTMTTHAAQAAAIPGCLISRAQRGRSRTSRIAGNPSEPAISGIPTITQAHSRSAWGENLVCLGQATRISDSARATTAVRTITSTILTGRPRDFGIVGLPLVLVLGGAGGSVVHRAKVQRDAVAAIERAHGHVYYQWQLRDVQIARAGQPRWPKWLVDRLGVDYFGDVLMVDLAGDGSDAV